MRALPFVVLLAVSAATSSAQTSSPASAEPGFEVASVKPNRSGATSSGSSTRPGGGSPCGMNTTTGATRGMLKGIGSGLKLESARGPVEFLVIDSAEPPTPD